MAKYVDGFVVPVQKSRIEDYRKGARKSGKIWLEHGALDYHECVADDVPYGKRTSFPRSVERKNSETVVFAWVTYKSRAHRDKVMAKVMADERMRKLGKELSFLDGERIIFGGFKPIVEM
jgi:uncharacterized protein YbaA (DUF1428 family)